MSSNPMIEFSTGLADAAERAGRGVVLVNGRRRFPASGVILQPGVVLTADHVLERDEEITVQLPDGDTVSASIAGRDSATDLAVLRLETDAGEPIQRSDRQGRVAELVLALGRPASSGIQASLGIVTAVRGILRSGGRGRRGRAGRWMMTQDPFIYTDAIPYPGFSGGPLINTAGEMIGLNTSGLVRGTSLAIPSGRALATGAALLEHGSVRRGYLGIRSQHTPLDEKQQAALGREQDAGLLLVWIEAGSPADAGGLIVGDILTAAGEGEIDDHASLQEALGTDTVGQSLEIEVLRGGERRMLVVTVGSR